MSRSCQAFAFLFSLLFFSYSWSQTCEQQFNEGIASYNSVCSGSQQCLADHPGGHWVGTDHYYSIAVNKYVKDGHLYLECRPTSSCPEYLYQILPIGRSSVQLCTNAPYDPGNVDDTSPPNDKNQKLCGSIVDVNSQTLGESIPLLGTTFSLNYFSHYTLGKNHTIFWRWSPRTGPMANTMRFTVEDETNTYASSAPQTFSQNISYTYNWNGNTFSGTPVWGPKIFNLNVWSVYSGMPNRVDAPVRNEVRLGAFNAKLLGLGGWIPSNYKFLSLVSTDVYSNEVYGGDGSTRSVTPYPLDPAVDGAVYYVGNVGNQEVDYFDSVGRILYTRTSRTGQKIRIFRYDSQFRLAEIEETFGRKTRFIRNAQGALLRIVAPKGVYTEGSTPVEATTLSAKSLVTMVTLNANGYITSLYGFNSPGKKYQMTYGAKGLLLTFRKPGGQLSTFQYNSKGDLIKDSHSGGYFFDLVKSVNLVTGVSTITSKKPSGATTTYQMMSGTTLYSPSSRTITRKSNGTVHDFESNWYSSISKFGDISEGITWTQDWRFPNSDTIWSYSRNNDAQSYNYSRSDDVVVSNTENPYSISTITTNEQDGTGATATTVYQGSNRTLTARTGMGRTQVAVLDAYERVISNKLGTLSPTTYTYTRDLLTEINQGVRKTVFAYNAGTEFLQSVTNPVGNRTQFQYDSQGRVIAQTLPDSRVIKFTYDANGNLRSLVTPANIAHNFQINASELSSSYVAPLVAGATVFSTTYTYDSDKKLTQVTRPGNDIITFGYNASGNLVKITGASGSFNISNEPRKRIPAVIQSPSGLKTRSTYGGYTVQKDELMNNSNVILGSYERFWNSDLMYQDIVTDGTGQAFPVDYEYNSDRDMVRAGALRLTYNQNRQISQTTIGAGANTITDSYTYNAFGEMTQYVVKRGTVILYQLNLTRDALGRITQKKQVMRGQTVTWGYAYDAAGRLIRVNKNGAAQSVYGYNANSNRVSGNVGTQTTTATYDKQDRLLTYNAFAFSYKPNGQLTQRRNTTTNVVNNFNYDSFGNLKSYTQGSTNLVAYQHDGRNRIAGRTVSGSLDRRWVYMDQYRMVGEINPATGALLRRLVYATKKNAPDYFQTANGQRFKVVTDHLGSLRLVIRLSDGTVVNWMDHDEFGRVIEASAAQSIPLGFAGGFYDGKTPLIRFGARDYFPDIGRWASKDPISFSGGDTNLYGYVASDSINYIDPTGLWGFWGGWGWTVAAPGATGSFGATGAIGSNGCGGISTGMNVGGGGSHLGGGLSAGRGFQGGVFFGSVNSWLNSGVLEINSPLGGITVGFDGNGNVSGIGFGGPSAGISAGYTPSSSSFGVGGSAGECGCDN